MILQNLVLCLCGPGGGDAVRRGPEPAEGVLPHGGGDPWPVGHLPGAARPFLRAGGRGTCLAPRCLAILREGPLQWSGGWPVLPGPVPQVRALWAA